MEEQPVNSPDWHCQICRSASKSSGAQGRARPLLLFQASLADTWGSWFLGDS